MRVRAALRGNYPEEVTATVIALHSGHDDENSKFQAEKP